MRAVVRSARWQNNMPMIQGSCVIKGVSLSNSPFKYTSDKDKALQLPFPIVGAALRSAKMRRMANQATMLTSLPGLKVSLCKDEPWCTTCAASFGREGLLGL